MSSTQRDLERGETSKNKINYVKALTSYEVHWRSWLMELFLAINVVVFFVAMYVNDCPKKNLGFEGDCFPKFLGRFSFQPLGENLFLGPSSSTLIKMGGLQWDDVVNYGQGWRLIACIWLHGGVVHLAINMLNLGFIGIRLEQQFGFVRIGIIYLLSGFGGSVMSSLFHRNNYVSMGASGALFGLVGAMLSELITNWSIYTNKAAGLFILLIAIVSNLAIGLLPIVDNFGHIGGCLTGFLLGFMLLLHPQFGWLEFEQPRPAAVVLLKSKYKAYQHVLWIVSAILLIVGLSIALVMLFRGESGYDHCHWCHYLTCLPTSKHKWQCNDN